jgi:hypothetical protein
MGAVRELPAGDALKQRRCEREMNSITDKWPNPGDLLHAALEGWVISEISDATCPKTQPMPLIEPRRGQGLQSFRASRVLVSARSRPAG